MKLMRRRNFIDLFFGGSLLATVASFLYPVIRYVLPTKESAAAQKSVAAAKVGELAPNTAKIFKFGSKPAVLINTAEGKLLALAATCTHLTCTVRYESDSSTLFCPCHNGRFDLSGAVISGPPPAPLETYVIEVAGEDVIVSRKG
jgi:Rieske Fe-S protein